MQKYGLNQLRSMFLEFFESKGHLKAPSFSLVPENDKSLLLINSGMAPLKPYFTGAVKPPSPRMTTCQKCIRTPDIENVGITSRHGTFFEMLGNFSFGDYFKHEAIAWAWEFLTEKVGLPAEKLYITVYTDDDEAWDIWTKEIGIPLSRINRLGKEDNFWEHGTGPCGPCSEIHFDRGATGKPCDNPDCRPGCQCNSDRFVEIWNLVFTQFNKDEAGNYTPLENKNIDTGMGLERLACMVQGVPNLFEVDTVMNILKYVCGAANVEYKKNERTDISIRVITDHIRSTVMMISDGVLPSNEGRGYVLRRLLRRAARHGKLLGVKEAFLADVADVAIRESCEAYPQLIEKESYIKKIISIEEAKFQATIDQGLAMLDAYIAEMKASGKKIIPGDFVFKLHDTYGFPLDLTKEIALENGLEADEAGFAEEMGNQKRTARAAHLAKGGSAWREDAFPVLGTETTEFTGYDTTEGSARILYMIADNEIVEKLEKDDAALIILDKTPFYAESGGQAGDTGMLVAPDGSVFAVETTKKLHDGKIVHEGRVVSGSFSDKTAVEAKVDAERRKATARNHSATHILQKALRNVLGDHVHQAGSYVDGERLRFDFSHFQAMTPDELDRVEREANLRLLEDLKVTCTVMPIEEARKLNAVALFGEKYGDRVRVVRMGDYSLEFCGGTHLESTAQAGMLKILSESGVAAGVRRIEAVTGVAAYDYVKENENLISEVSGALKAAPKDMIRRVEQLNAELKAGQKELEKLNSRLISGSIDELVNSASDISGVSLITAKFDGMDIDTLRNTADQLKQKRESAIIVLASVADGRVNFIAAATPAAVQRGADAGAIVKAAAVEAGGGGGGRRDMAQAGGKDASKTASALDKAAEVARGQIK